MSDPNTYYGHEIGAIEVYTRTLNDDEEVDVLLHTHLVDELFTFLDEADVDEVATWVVSMVPIKGDYLIMDCANALDWVEGHRRDIESGGKSNMRFVFSST